MRALDRKKKDKNINFKLGSSEVGAIAGKNYGTIKNGDIGEFLGKINEQLITKWKNILCYFYVLL